eukprot:1880157-Alexandrium_andersonii.AAC.1
MLRQWRTCAPLLICTPALTARPDPARPSAHLPGRQGMRTLHQRLHPPYAWHFSRRHTMQQSMLAGTSRAQCTRSFARVARICPTRACWLLTLRN